MDPKRKKLIQIRTKLQFYKKLDKKIQKVLNAELDIQDWSEEVSVKIDVIEKQLDTLKMDMDLPDEEYNEDEE